MLINKRKKLVCSRDCCPMLIADCYASYYYIKEMRLQIQHIPVICSLVSKAIIKLCEEEAVKVSELFNKDQNGGLDGRVEHCGIFRKQICLHYGCDGVHWEADFIKTLTKLSSYLQCLRSY